MEVLHRERSERFLIYLRQQQYQKKQQQTTCVAYYKLHRFDAYGQGVQKKTQLSPDKASRNEWGHQQARTPHKSGARHDADTTSGDALQGHEPGSARALLSSSLPSLNSFPMENSLPWKKAKCAKSRSSASMPRFAAIPARTTCEGSRTRHGKPEETQDREEG